MANNDLQVKILPHDPLWTTRYREEAKTLRALFGEQMVAIHHIGSTAVPELPAKPIIDILLEVHDINLVDLFANQMRQLGYESRGEFGLPRRRYFPKIVAGEHTCHVHTWQTGDSEIERHISFRDYLIVHPEAVKAYGHMKKALAEKFAGDRERYIMGKHEFCQEIERRAIRWQHNIRAHAIQTKRLSLLPLNPAQLWHYLNRQSQIEAALHLQLSRSILADPVPQAIRSKLRRLAGASLEQLLWHTYWLAIIRAESFGAGLIGFKGAPEADGTVEIGYGIDPARRRQGFVTEAAGALVDWALKQPACQAVTACTKKGNAASIRILEKLDFTLARETDEESWWIVSGPSAA